LGGDGVAAMVWQARRQSAESCSPTNTSVCAVMSPIEMADPLEYVAANPTTGVAELFALGNGRRIGEPVAVLVAAGNRIYALGRHGHLPTGRMNR
jgi:hypothetical protein